MFSDQISESAKVSKGDKVPDGRGGGGGRPLPFSLWKKAIICLTCQFRVSAHFASFARIVLTSLVPYIFGILAIFDHRVHVRVVMEIADFMLFSCPHHIWF